MKAKIFLFGLLVSTMTMVGQTTDTKDAKKETWYFKVGGSYFLQTAATEFPTVGGQAANKDVYVGNTSATNKLDSRESVTGSFGEGFRSGITAGYRFSPRLGVEMAANYYSSQSKTMAQTTNRYMASLSPTGTESYLSFDAEGKIKAFDLAPAIVLFLGESHGFEPYTKVGVIVPIDGTLNIDTNKEVLTYAGGNLVNTTKISQTDVVKPNATVGFMAALGTSYKLGNHISAFAELEYRNFTVHGKTKETTDYSVNGADKLSTLTTSAIHTNYGDKLTSTSNNSLTNSSVDTTKPMDELSSYVGISGLGMTLGLKYSL